MFFAHALGLVGEPPSMAFNDLHMRNGSLSKGELSGIYIILMTLLVPISATLGWI